MSVHLPDPGTVSPIADKQWGSLVFEKLGKSFWQILSMPRMPRWWLRGAHSMSDAKRPNEVNETADSPRPQNPGRFEVRVTADSHMAWLRTRLSLERTMMSWLRTAVSLIGFGFAIVQFFERLQQMPGTKPALHANAPKYLGLALILCGVLALLVSLWQYFWGIRYLRGEPFTPIAGVTEERMNSPVIAVGALLILIGLYAFIAVLLRLV
jgi:putative membrane protein